MHYSVQPRDRIFVKDYGYLSFATNMGKSIGKNISKSFSNKYSQKRLGHSNYSAIDALKPFLKKNELGLGLVIKSPKNYKNVRNGTTG